VIGADGSVGTATRVRVSARPKQLFAHHCVQRGSGVLRGVLGIFPRGVKLTTRLYLCRVEVCVELYFHSPTRLPRLMLNKAEGQLHAYLQSHTSDLSEAFRDIGVHILQNICRGTNSAKYN
jgi:hypothetical protein